MTLRHPDRVSLIAQAQRTSGGIVAWFSTTNFDDAMAIWKSNNPSGRPDKEDYFPGTGLRLAMFAVTDDHQRFVGNREQRETFGGRLCVQAHRDGMSANQARKVVTALNKKASENAGNNRHWFKHQERAGGAFQWVVPNTSEKAPITAAEAWDIIKKELIPANGGSGGKKKSNGSDGESRSEGTKPQETKPATQTASPPPPAAHKPQETKPAATPSASERKGGNGFRSLGTGLGALAQLKL